MKNYKYVRFTIILTGMWKVNGEKKFRAILLSEETIEFLQIVSQQTLSLPKMFEAWHWTRWNEEQLQWFLEEIRKATFEGG